MAQRLDAAKAAKLLTSPLQYILLDIDGVLWCGGHVIPKVPETLQHLRSTGKKLRFLSNNASLSREQLMQTFAKKGIESVTAAECYNSAYAAALRLQRLLGRPTTTDEGEVPRVHGNIFVIGEQGLHDELQQVLAPGFITYGMELHDAAQAGGYHTEQLGAAWRSATLPPPLKRLVSCDGNTCKMVQAGTDNAAPISLSDLNAVAVVVGLDMHFNILKLAYASIILQGPPKDLRGSDAAAKSPLFIATNEDPQIPIGSDGVLLPGAGAMVSSLSTVSNRKPDAVCGKPHVDMAMTLFEAEGIKNPAEQCLMVGDRVTTDIAFGNAAKCQTLLVLSGVEGLDDVAAAEKDGNKTFIPTYIADSLATLLPE